MDAVATTGGPPRARRPTPPREDRLVTTPTTLLELIDLQVAAPGRYVGPASWEPHVRAFGGQLLAQACAAVARHSSVDRQLHSFHCYFLRPGGTDGPVEYHVDVLREGRSFSVMEVTAVQDGETLLEGSASLHARERGLSHQDQRPETPGPEGLEPFHVRFAGRDAPNDMERWFARTRELDLRYVDRSPFEPPTDQRHATQRVWVRYTGPALTMPWHQQAILAYISDLVTLDPILLRHGRSWTDRAIMGASLDHALWFHQVPDVTRWMLLDLRSPIATGGRATATGQVWSEDGDLVCTLVQEALMRPPRRFA